MDPLFPKNLRRFALAELDTDGHLMFLLEFVIHYSLHETTLANAGVSNNDKLEEMVLCGDRLV